MAGTTFDIVVLSSSPPEHSAPPPHINGHPLCRVAVPLSSPLRYSPPMSPLRSISGAPRSNSRTAPITESAVRGFATVGSLVQSEYFVEPVEGETPPVQQAGSRRGSRETIHDNKVPTKKPRKRTTKTTAEEDDVEKPKPKPKPRARKPKANKDIPAADPELRLPAPTKSHFFNHETTESTTDPTDEVVPKLTKSGKPRKPRTKKQMVEEQGVESIPKPKRTRVTKAKKTTKDGQLPREDAALTSAQKRDAAGQTNEELKYSLGQGLAPVRDDATIWEVPQSPRPKKKTAPKQKKVDPLAEGLDLEEAVTRRRDWTPPCDTAVVSHFTDSIGKENKSLEPNTNGTFTHLVSNFAYAQSPSFQTTATTTESVSTNERMPVTKRQRVELMDIPGHQTNSRNSSPEKGKAPKKKSRTITDIVTEQYAPKEVSPDPNAVISNFFDARSTTSKVPLNDNPGPDGIEPPKKAPRKQNNSKSDLEKTGANSKPKRAPKKSAAKPKPISEKLLSPTSALSRLSRQNVLFGTSSQLALEESPATVRQIQQAMRESERDSSFLDDSFLAAPPRWPKLERTIGRRGLWSESARDADGGMLEHMEDVHIPEPDRTEDIQLLMDGSNDDPDVAGSFIDIDDIEPLPQHTAPSDSTTPLQTASQTMKAVEVQDDDYPMIDDILEEQQPPPSNQNAESQHSFADIDDFTPPPARVHASVPSQLPSPTPDSTNTSPKKRRGRPPKSKPASTPQHSTPRFIDIEEILDSEDEALSPFSPTPPRVHRLADLPPLPLTSPSNPSKSSTPDPTIPRIHRIPATHLEWSAIKPTIFTALTSHIRSLPPTRDPHNPSWHEKILMFDPIVIEDFTAYVNANTQVRVFRRATQKQVKAWNAELKRCGGAGVLDVRDKAEDEVYAVEKELEGFMVKAWCEGLSVCCVNRIKGNGRKRKGFY
ncbi:hypothetical protein IAQ61_010688 [Plenodomus lingam]|uniref:uncharacterized protein n=1 Tax=Leptosphaeria maculans TaxID=5022 RepID=UPI003319E136|nr:hypothetical protein IAQ61_010688 [Plenodomus lingam]